MERVALAHAVNGEIRTLAERFHLRGDDRDVAWLCACGCFAVVRATLAAYDRAGGEVFAEGHPFDAIRSAASAAFHEHPDLAGALPGDEELRRALTRDLAARLDQEAASD